MPAERPLTAGPPPRIASEASGNHSSHRRQKVEGADPDVESGARGTRGLTKIVTLGVYGSTEAGFFGTLQREGVDTFCDLRLRRGVRGSEYAFVNRRRLEAQLAEKGIRYLHFKHLAPSQALRERQTAADKTQHTGKRRRAELSELFITGYCEECLRDFDSRKFLAQLGGKARVVALFCVERAPAACHRSLLAQRLQRDLGLEVVHLTPD